MKTVTIIFQLLLLTIALLASGCRFPIRTSETSEQTSNDLDILSLYIRYAPVKTDIMPLTEFINGGDTEQAHINLYISLIDSFGSQIKSPGVFRFELYEHAQRSPESKGKRLEIWPYESDKEDYIDLTNILINNQYWRDFLRGYEFNLPYDGPLAQSYILRATFLSPGGKRLSKDITLKPTKSSP